MAKKLEYTVASTFQKNKFTNQQQKQGWINLKNLDPTDAITLNKQFHGLQKSANSIAFCVTRPNVATDVRTKNLASAYEYLASTQNYEMPKFEEILTDLGDVMSDLVTNSEFKQTEMNTDKMWLEFMKMLEDPKIQELLRSMGQYNLAKDAYGWKISFHNIQRVLATKPDATFVQTRNNWKNLFGRRLKKDATRLILLVPLKNNTATADDKRKTMDRLGFSKDTDYSMLTTQQKQSVDNFSSTRDATYFIRMPYYDVSDTELINPNGHDKWSEEEGYDNNMTRHLNKAALLNAGGDVPQEEREKIYNNENGDLKLLATTLANGIKRKYPSVRVSLPRQDNEDAYAMCYKEMVSNLADYLIENKAKIAKAENRTQSIKIVSLFVLCFTHVCADDVLVGLKNDVLTDKAYLELRTIINDIIWLLNTNTNMSESKGYIMEKFKTLDSLDQMLSMMGMTRNDVKKDEEQLRMESLEKERKTIKEQFDKMMNRIKQADDLKREWREE